MRPDRIALQSGRSRVLPRGIASIPGGVWALGFVSMCMDVSSEMIQSLLPVFLVTVLGASPMTVGVIEGLGESTASVSKLFSGWLSDLLGKRKALTLVGYGMGALSKPFFAVAPSAGWILGARFTDRLGKGIRGAPRDALVGDITPPELRGAAYGLRQSLDTIGAFAGPLLALGLMLLFADDFRRVFWVAVVPGVAAVGILALFVREPPTRPRAARALLPRRDDLSRFGLAFWGIVGVSTVLTLARISEAFLVLRAKSLGLAVALMPLVFVTMNVVYALSAYPMGALSDRVDRRVILSAGFAVLVLADVVLAFSPSVGIVMLGVGLWGLHMGMTQGLLAALVADAAGAELRGTAFGVFNFATGIALLVASVVAGALWAAKGPSATFLAGAGFTVLGLVGMVAVLRLMRRTPAKSLAR